MYIHARCIIYCIMCVTAFYQAQLMIKDVFFQVAQFMELQFSGLNK